MNDAANLQDHIEKLREELILRAQEIEERNQEIKEKNQQIDENRRYILQLEELIKQSNRKRFSSSSEKAPPEQLGFFDEAETILEESAQEENSEEDTSASEPNIVTVAEHTRKKKPRASIPAELPREDIIHDLAEDEKVCPHDGTALSMIGSEDHEQLDIIPATIKVIRHRRLKYACPCCEQFVVTADKPKQAIEKSIASPGLLAFVATQKYCDALPLYRQSEILSRTGIEINRTNLANWMIRCGKLIQPLINLLREQLLDRPVIQMDETSVQVLKEPGRAPENKSYMWLMASFKDQPIILFNYESTRSQSAPLKYLSSQTKALMVDGYEGYQAACDRYGIQRLGCWAHARRKFVDAQKLQGKGKTGKADQAINFIQKLYLVEKKIKHETPEKRYQFRQEQSRPFIDEIERWMKNSLPHVPPKTTLGKALNYLHKQWPRLIAYLDDGNYPIDNNLTENAIRPFAVGRKNWLFSDSQAGVQASANLYSLIETAKANKLNPFVYLKQVFTELPNAQSVDDIERLLPWRVTEAN